MGQRGRALLWAASSLAMAMACARTGLYTWGDDSERAPDIAPDVPPPEEPDPLTCPDLLAAAGCDVQTARAQRAGTNVLIVLDKSGSMDFQVEGVDKWGAATGAVATTISTALSSVKFGLQLFPFPDDANEPIGRNDCGAVGNCCEMPDGDAMNVPISETAAPAIVDLLAVTEPGGGTPTTVALARARRYFANTNLTGTSFVLLVTDGGPNCNAELVCSADECTINLDGACGEAPDANCCDHTFAGDGIGCVDSSNVLGEIEALFDAGIATLVVGIPGSEPYAQILDEAAVAGGMPKDDGAEQYYRVDDVRALGDELNSLVSEVVTDCRIELGAPSETMPVVAIDCSPLVAETDHRENWRWDEDDNSVLLLGETCEAFLTGERALDIIVDCKR